MAVQWTVSFPLNELTNKSRALLNEEHEYQLVERLKVVEVDMSEEEFFSFADSIEQTLSTDGSNSWSKHV